MIEREPNVRTGVELFHSDEKMRIEAATYSVELAQHSPYMTLKDAEREQWALLSILSDVHGGGQDAAYELPAAQSTPYDDECHVSPSRARVCARAGKTRRAGLLLCHAYCW